VWCDEKLKNAAFKIILRKSRKMKLRELVKMINAEIALNAPVDVIDKAYIYSR